MSASHLQFHGCCSVQTANVPLYEESQLFLAMQEMHGILCQARIVVAAGQGAPSVSECRPP